MLTDYYICDRWTNAAVSRYKDINCMYVDLYRSWTRANRKRHAKRIVEQKCMDRYGATDSDNLCYNSIVYAFHE